MVIDVQYIICFAYLLYRPKSVVDQADTGMLFLPEALA
jgi:hypothetical protein